MEGLTGATVGGLDGDMSDGGVIMGCTIASVSSVALLSSGAVPAAISISTRSPLFNSIALLQSTLVIPLLLLTVGQFMGVLLVNTWILLGLGALCALAAGILLKRSMGRFSYEMLLK